MRVLFLIMSILPLAASAEVYRCETGEGLTFTDRPCEGAQVVEMQQSAGIGPSRYEVLQTRVALDEEKLERAQRRYRANIVRRQNRELGRIDGQITQLEARKALASNNLAGATYAAGLDQQIAALRNAQGQIIAARGQQVHEAALASINSAGVPATR